MELYDRDGCCLTGSFKEGCISLYFEIDTDELKSEIGYSIDKENTDMLLNILSLDEFWILCKKGLYYAIEYLDSNNIKYSTHQYW